MSGAPIMIATIKRAIRKRSVRAMSSIRGLRNWASAAIQRAATRTQCNSAGFFGGAFVAAAILTAAERKGRSVAEESSERGAYDHGWAGTSRRAGGGGRGRRGPARRARH